MQPRDARYSADPGIRFQLRTWRHDGQGGCRSLAVSARMIRAGLAGP
jgi:hypothetical protein